MQELTHFSLCSGIGGLDLAAEWAGFKTVAQCEIDDYASKVLAKNFKGVPNLNDIRTVTNERLRKLGINPAAITVVSAGFPCQPYSLAGKGLGDSDSRDLWGRTCDGGWWQTEPDVGRVANGISARVDRLRCNGNAVVPYQALPIFEAIVELEAAMCG